MSITWNGVSSDTIGVIVERIPNRYVPTRRFSPQQVAGRNGNILLVDKAFPNVEQEYEVYLSAESQGLPSVARACAEWLMGPDGYCRLTDSYDTTVYREAFLLGGFDIENILNKFGRCTITFSCKPQKYLLTGDTPIEIPAGSSTTYTGDVVQFDGVTGASITSLSTTITPIQDLHGYSSPWPAGGGVNKYPIQIGEDSFVNNGRATHSNSDGALVIVTNSGNSASGVYLSSGAKVIDAINACTTPLTVSMDIVATASGSVRIVFCGSQQTFTIGATKQRISVTATSTSTNNFNIYGVNNGATLTISNLQIESGSTDTAYAPYSNICPISGRTGVDVYRTGKNLLNDTDFRTYSSWDNVAPYGTYKTQAGTLGYELPVADGATYTISFGITADSFPTYLYLCRGNGTDTTELVQRFTAGASDPVYATDKTFTAEAGWMYYLRLYTNNSTYFDGQVEKIANEQLELGSTATTYEPYNGNTYAVDWTTQAGTVYGGTLDVVTGVLTVDRANIASYNGEVINEPWLSSMDEYAPGATPTTGAQVVYKLATPLTYQLTAQEIEVLVGENNVWTSSGPVSVTVEAPFVGTVTNPTPFEARPLLEVSGLGEITINGKSIQILEAVSDFQIDCETMEAEDNSKIYCMDFPELSGGENEIVGDGSITALTVTPRWWTL